MGWFMVKREMEWHEDVVPVDGEEVRSDRANEEERALREPERSELRLRQLVSDRLRREELRGGVVAW